MFRKLESSSFHSFAPTTETDIAIMLVRVYFYTKSFFTHIKQTVWFTNSKYVIYLS